MGKCKYEFKENAINKMYYDCLEQIFSTLNNENPDFTIDELNIFISIGDKEIEIPIGAEEFELLFNTIREMEKLNNEQL